MSKFDWKELSTGDDLIVVLGHYRTPRSEIVKTLLNKPKDILNGEVTVDYYPASMSNLYGTQILRHTNGIYKRVKENTSWTEWQRLVTKDDLPNIYGVQFGKNNEYSDHVQTIKNIWNQFPDNKPFVCTLADSNKFVAVGYIYDSKKYGAVLYLAFNSCGIVKCSGGNFSDTKL